MERVVAVSLKKGQKISLTKGTNLKNIHVGLGWKENAYGGDEMDLDASVFLLNSRGKCRRDEDFIFYSNLTAPGIEHTGDERTGGDDSDDGDQEVIFVNLNDIPSGVDKIDMVVTIHDAERLHQNFGQVKDAFIRIVDKDTDKELFRYDLEEDFSTETAVLAGSIYRKGSDWSFSAVGQGHVGGLQKFCSQYGLDAE